MGPRAGLDNVKKSTRLLGSRKVAGSINPSSRTIALGSSQRLTEMSKRNLSGGRGRPARKIDNLTAICKRIV
jgi:hypothetical protein